LNQIVFVETAWERLWQAGLPAQGVDQCNANKSATEAQRTQSNYSVVEKRHAICQIVSAIAQRMLPPFAFSVCSVPQWQSEYSTALKAVASL
jgi:hypothetical protein